MISPPPGMSGKRKPSSSSSKSSEEEEAARARHPALSPLSRTVSSPDLAATPKPAGTPAPTAAALSETFKNQLILPESLVSNRQRDLQATTAEERANQHDTKTSQAAGATPPGAGMWPGARQRTSTQPKKKKSVISVDTAPEVKEEPVLGTTTVRGRRGRDPLPMKLRALPQSFWQQPNTNTTSPNTGSLPPLVTTSKDAQDINEVPPITPPDQRSEGRSPDQARCSGGSNPDLLFSLFDTISPPGDRKRLVVRRARAKKSIPEDEDPYMTSSATDSILPLLPDRSSGSGTPASRGTQILSVVQMVGPSDRESICLPSLSVEHNYSNILSQLVMKL